MSEAEQQQPAVVAEKTPEQLAKEAERKARKEAKKAAKAAKAAAKAEKKKKQQQGGKKQGGKKGGKQGGKQTKLGMSAHKTAAEFPEWYDQVIRHSEMLSYYPEVSGCYVLRPNSLFVWNAIQEWFDGEIKKLGVENAYFPLFVSKRALEKEEDHLEGFAAEVAWVTKSGKSDLAEPIAIRPTSETVMYPFYSQWVRSHRDLPLRLNQWTNVVRWEFKHPTPFIRTREFLWQEGHSAYADKADADVEVRQILDLYRDVYEKLLAVPVVQGVKTDAERFPGGDYTTTVEAFIPEVGRSVQGATSHGLGQNFAKMFDITFEGKDGKSHHVWQNSWGITTRTIGVMVMTHSDDKGLVLPPRVARYQVVIVPILRSNSDTEAVMARADEMAAALKEAGVRVKVDDRSHVNPGWKFNDWELKGVPLRVELGERDLASNSCVVARRDTGNKSTVAFDANFGGELQGMLDCMQQELLDKARAKYDACRVKVTSWDEFIAVIGDRKAAIAPFCGNPECEDFVKKMSKESFEALAAAAGPNTDVMTGAAKSMCMPYTEKPEEDVTQHCCFEPSCRAKGTKAVSWTMFGRSY